MRGSDPDAGLYWMARMIEAGEDPRFLARRMVILASEDIGLADPQALLVAEAAARAVEYVGLPEAALNLAEAVIYLARAPKSNAVVVALGRAQADVRSGVSQEVPAHLRDAHYKRCRHRSGTGRATSIPTMTPPEWWRSSIVLTHSRVTCTTSRRPKVPRARAGPTGAGRLIRESGSPTGRVPGGRVGGVGRGDRSAPGRWRNRPAPRHPTASSCRRARRDSRRTQHDLGAAPAAQVLDLDVTLAGQDPAGLAQAAAARLHAGIAAVPPLPDAGPVRGAFGPSADRGGAGVVDAAR